MLSVPEAMDILHILDVVARGFNPSTRETGTKSSVNFETSMVYIARPRTAWAS